MLTGVFQSVVLIGVAAIFYGIDFFLISRFDRKRTSEKSGRSWDFTLLMFVVVAAAAAQPVVLPWLGIRIPGAAGFAIQMVGILMILVALCLHFWSRAHLQQYYAERVEIQENHQVIDSGPYACIRHPVFTSFFGLVTGLVLVNPALTTLLLAAYTYWDFLRAGRQEEELLSANLPGYREYMARTQAYLPRPGAWMKARDGHES